MRSHRFILYIHLQSKKFFNKQFLLIACGFIFNERKLDYIKFILLVIFRIIHFTSKVYTFFCRVVIICYFRFISLLYFFKTTSNTLHWMHLVFVERFLFKILHLHKIYIVFPVLPLLLKFLFWKHNTISCSKVPFFCFSVKKTTSRGCPTSPPASISHHHLSHSNIIRNYLKVSRTPHRTNKTFLTLVCFCNTKKKKKEKSTTSSSSPIRSIDEKIA